MEVKTLYSIIPSAHYLFYRWEDMGISYMYTLHTLEYTLHVIFFFFATPGIPYMWWFFLPWGLYYFEELLLARKLEMRNSSIFNLVIENFLDNESSLPYISFAIPYHSPLRKHNYHFNILPKILLSQIQRFIAQIFSLPSYRRQHSYDVPSIHNVNLPLSSLLL